jgi:hypothetical protein
MTFDPGLFVYSTWAQMAGKICSFFYRTAPPAPRAGTLENAATGAPVLRERNR